MTEAWTCPVCGAGKAPAVTTCHHEKPTYPPTTTLPNYPPTTIWSGPLRSCDCGKVTGFCACPVLVPSIR